MARQSKIDKYGLHTDVMNVFKANPKASYNSISEMCNTLLKNKGIKDTISAKSVERFVKSNMKEIMEQVSDKQAKLAAVSMNNLVQMQEELLWLYDETKKLYEDFRIRESDTAAIKALSLIRKQLRDIREETGQLSQKVATQTNVYNLNFGPSVNQYITDLKNNKKLMCRMCKSTDIIFKE